MRIVQKSAGIGLALTLAVSSASADVITADTYIDSYDARQYSLASSADVNYGGSAATKAVSSAGSTQYPLATSAVRSLFKLPDSFWSSIGTSDVDAATFTLRVRNFNNNSPFSRTLTAYPLSRSFVVGNGFQPTVPGGTIPNTQGGTQNTPGNPVGADWFTFDGTNPWTTPGGDFNTSAGVLGVLNTVGVTTFSWDLTSLVNTAETREQLQQFGLLVKITDDTNYPAPNTQDFLSFWSYEGANTQANPAAFYPQVTFTLVPEPASIAALGVVVLSVVRRSRKVM